MTPAKRKAAPAKKAKGNGSEGRPPEQDVTPEILAIAHASPAITWRRYEIGLEDKAKSKMSCAARGIDDALACDAWRNPDGSCRVEADLMKALCVRDKLNLTEMWDQLRVGGRWVLDETRTWLTATWLVEARLAAAMAIAVKIVLGRRSGSSRGKAPMGRDEPEEQPLEQDAEHPVHDAPWPENETAPDFPNGESRNSQSRNDMQDARTECSAGRSGEQSIECRTDAPTEHSVQHSGEPFGVAASAPERAAPPTDSPTRRGVPNLRALAEDAPRQWCLAHAGEVLTRLEAAAPPRVAVAASLHRLGEALQRQHGPTGHAALVAECEALLRGVGGRDGLVPVHDAPRLLALALHGAASVPGLVTPLVLRAIAQGLAVHVQERRSAADLAAVAVVITQEIRDGARPASAVLLPDEVPARPPLRLLGHRTREEIPAA